MQTPSIIWIGAFLGSTIGGFIPELWGADFLSFSSILCSALGGILGVWGAFKLSHY
jgi:predicted MFS family arabinose efflux permease